MFTHSHICKNGTKDRSLIKLKRTMDKAGETRIRNIREIIIAQKELVYRLNFNEASFSDK